MPLGDGPRGGGPLFNPKSVKYRAGGPFGKSEPVRGMRLDPCCPTVLTHLPRVFDDVPAASNAGSAGPRHPRGGDQGLNESAAAIDDPATRGRGGERFGQPQSCGGGRVEARFTGLVAASPSSRQPRRAEKDDTETDFEASSSASSTASAPEEEAEGPKLPHGHGVLEGVVYDHAGRAVATHVLRCGDWSHGVADGRASERVTRLDPVTGDVLEVDYREGVFDRGVRARGFEATDIIRRGTGSSSASPAQPPLSGGVTPRAPSPVQQQQASDGRSQPALRVARAPPLDAAATPHGASARNVLGGHLDADDDDPVATKAYRGPGDALCGERLSAARATSDLLQILAAAEHAGAGGGGGGGASTSARASPAPKPAAAAADPFRTHSSTPHGGASRAVGTSGTRAASRSRRPPYQQQSPYGVPSKPARPKTARASSRGPPPPPSSLAVQHPLDEAPASARLPPRAPSSSGAAHRPLSGRASSTGKHAAASHNVPQPGGPPGCSPRPPSALANAARQALRAVAHRDPLADLSGGGVGNATPQPPPPPPAAEASDPHRRRRTSPTLRSRSRFDGLSTEYRERMAQHAAEATEQAADDAAVRHGRLLDAQWNSVVAGVVGYASNDADRTQEDSQRTPRHRHRPRSARPAGKSSGSAAAAFPSSNPAKGPFRLGQHVVVHTSRENIHGIVRYCGHRRDGRPGTIVGVETEVQHAGYHDGSVHGRTYFSCEPGHGVLVPTSHVSSAFDSRPFET